jgi:hypothetical protein
VAVTFEQFQKVTRALVMHLRQHEDSVEEGMSLCGFFFITHILRERARRVKFLLRLMYCYSMQYILLHLTHVYKHPIELNIVLT